MWDCGPTPLCWGGWFAKVITYGNHFFPVSALAAHLRLAVARTARRLRQEAGGGLSPTLTAALATVERHGPLTPSELAARERVQRPTATKLVARLEADGLVARTADPTDGRSR